LSLPVRSSVARTAMRARDRSRPTGPYSTVTSPSLTPRVQTTADVGVTSPTVTSTPAVASDAPAGSSRIAATAAMTARNAITRASLGMRSEVGEELLLEARDRLSEGRPEVAPAVTAVAERTEVGDHRGQPVAADQVVDHEKRELIGRHRTVTTVSGDEAGR